MINAQILSQSVNGFVERCQLDMPFSYSSTIGGAETLYASCFAVMIKHYTGTLSTLPTEEKEHWANYLNKWQDEETGRFIGLEISNSELTSPMHDWNHITMHLTAHVLPALDLLGAKTKHPLFFAHTFLDLSKLQRWLEQRDWKDAWLEGNNLLFILQFLVHLRDRENLPEAQESLDMVFNWLDMNVDPKTGLWGTNGYCSTFVAMCGGYHQLLAYYHENKLMQYPERLIESTLSLQHSDGGFNPNGGGGACEDVDAVDILVNLYKRFDYKRSWIRSALRKALRSVLEKHMPDGGFVYNLNQPFMHMGIKRTVSSPNQSNIFATWFRTHTIALISEILTDEPVSRFDWLFNTVLSMGWHHSWDKSSRQISSFDRIADRWASMLQNIKRPYLFITRLGIVAKARRLLVHLISLISR